MLLEKWDMEFLHSWLLFFFSRLEKRTNSFITEGNRGEYFLAGMERGTSSSSWLDHPREMQQLDLKTMGLSWCIASRTTALVSN